MLKECIASQSEEVIRAISCRIIVHAVGGHIRQLEHGALEGLVRHLLAVDETVILLTLSLHHC